MRQRTTTTALLAVIAALLGLNLIAKSSPAAVGQGQAGPVQPTVVAGAAVSINTVEGHVVRFWSDGAIDTTPVYLDPFPDGPCDARVICNTIPLLPGACTADVTRNGEVEITDFLEVLGQWGPCQ